jgi:signal transduction histidine kinase/CheY-like chemotaxis protein
MTATRERAGQPADSRLQRLLAGLTAVRSGDLSTRLPAAEDPVMDEIAAVFNGMNDQLSLFADEVTRVAREVGTEGHLGGQAEVEGVSGTWKRLTENVNKLAGNLTRQVRAIGEVASAVATGDLTRSISVEAQGEVAELMDNINAMVRSLRETTNAYQEQDWLQSSLARLARQMQGHRDLTVVAELIMNDVIPLVGAQHGTFFLAESDDRGETRLRLIAGYGLRRDPEEPSQFGLGQSLIGQAAKTRKPIVVTDLPADYVKISSGTGEAAPVNKAAQLARQNRDIENKNVQIEQARQELEERARQLDLASRYKSQFVANMSHELRTPLNSLLILARLLAQNPEQNLTPKQVEYAHVIHSSGADLLRLINDVLDLSQVEAGRMELHPERFALSGLLDDLQAVFRPLTTEKGLDFVAAPPSADVPAELHTDRQRLRQILHNLLSNAVKFTERGGVELRVVRVGQEAAPAEPTVAFAVTDTGVGISEQNLEGIFGAFQQGDGTTSRRYGGTGLGLAICRDLASQLGGRITATSAPGRGSTFTLHLPVNYPGPTAERPALDHGEAAAVAREPVDTVAGSPEAVPTGRESLRDKKVLVVDDDLRNAFAISSILELYGMTVLHAPDGRAGIETLRARDDIDIVLMDAMMPEMDGYATTRSIREIPDLRSLPVIAVTARAMPGDRDKTLAAGATDYVTKPVDAEELLTCMERWIGSRRSLG